MLKGLYFMAWYRDMWNYHPSLPMKNMQMIEDIQDVRGNMLIWSCLGSGAIGLPYLDLEANGETPPRMRLYGFMNDSEFCAECAKRGIKVFSVLWKAQLWEFPAEFNEDESRLLALNIPRNVSDNKGWIGMRELSTDRYPKLFRPMEDFFPGGLKNLFGETVTDFLDEFKAVSLEGRPILSAWLMAPGHDHKCYTPCSNKDSYLAYMKRDVEMMIDAGTGGLHIDEYDTQKHVTSNAGCFCRECVAKFRRYLKDRAIPLPEDAGDPETFDYREYLLSKGYKDEDLLAWNANERWKIPLFRHFFDMQMDSVEWVVRELSQHAKAYAKKTRGDANFPVTANLYQCFPLGDRVKKFLDLLAGEKTKLQMRQDGWYRFASGWLNGKDVCFTEDPNAYIRSIVTDIKDGFNDRFLLFALEPVAHGFHVAFPYGSWLQNQVKDAFWPDLRVLKKLGPWLDGMDPFLGKKHTADIGIIYDSPSAYENSVSEPSLRPDRPPRPDLTGVAELGRQGAFYGQGTFSAFFDLVQALSDRHVLYNVLFESPDEPLTAERLEGYRTVVVPEAFLMDPAFAEVLNAFRKNGGEVIALGRKIPQLGAETYRLSEAGSLAERLTKEDRILSAPESPLYSIDLRAMEDGGQALHIVNYNYHDETRTVHPIPELTFRLRFPAKSVTAHPFPENAGLKATLEGDVLRVENAGLYTILELH